MPFLDTLQSLPAFPHLYLPFPITYRLFWFSDDLVSFNNKTLEVSVSRGTYLYARGIKNRKDTVTGTVYPE